MDDTVGLLNELVTILQKWQNIDTFINGSEPHQIVYRDVFQMSNEHPEAFADLIKLARDQPSRLGFTENTGINPQEYTDSFITHLTDEFRLLPSDYILQTQDFNAARDYFRGDKLLSELSAKQQQVIRSLTYTEDQFTVDSGLFDFQHDGWHVRKRKPD